MTSPCKRAEAEESPPETRAPLLLWASAAAPHLSYARRREGRLRAPGLRRVQAHDLPADSRPVRAACRPSIPFPGLRQRRHAAARLTTIPRRRRPTFPRAQPWRRWACVCASICGPSIVTLSMAMRPKASVAGGLQAGSQRPGRGYRRPCRNRIRPTCPTIRSGGRTDLRSPIPASAASGPPMVVTRSARALAERHWSDAQAGIFFVVLADPWKPFPSGGRRCGDCAGRDSCAAGTDDASSVEDHLRPRSSGRVDILINAAYHVCGPSA